MKNYALKVKENLFFLKNPLLFLIILFILIKLLFLTRFHTIIWDEAVYLGMGKYLFSLGRIGIWEIFRPIALPVFLGIGYFFGLNQLVFGEILLVLFSAGSIYFTYLVGKTMFDKKTGFLSAFFLAITPVFFLYSGYILTDIPSLFFVLVSLYFLVKDASKPNYIFCGIFAGLAFLTRFPHGLFLAGILLFFGIKFLLKRTKKNFYPLLYISMSFLFVQIPFWIFNLLIYHKETGKLYHALFRPLIYAWSHQYNPAEIVGQKFFYFIQLSQQNFWLMFAVFGIIFSFATKKYKKSALALFLTVFTLYFVYFNWIPNKQQRFMLSFLPYLCIFASYGIFEFITRVSKEKKYPQIKNIIFGIVLLFSLILIVPTDVNYYFWRPADAPDIVTSFYEYFKEQTNISNPLKILTADPVPSAYVEARFEPIYFSLDTAYNSYHNFDYDYIIYSTNTYYCAPEDKKCEEEITNFFNLMSSQNKLTFTKKYETRSYYIYSKHPEKIIKNRRFDTSDFSPTFSY